MIRGMLLTDRLASPSRPVPKLGLFEIEPLRVSRRLHLLRGWSHDKTKEVFTGGKRARSVGLIQFRGHFLKGGYDVHNGKDNAAPATPPGV